MLVPDKFTPFALSSLGHVAHLHGVASRVPDVISLFRSSDFPLERVDDFILALDAMFLMGLIDIDLESGVIRHAG